MTKTWQFYYNSIFGAIGGLVAWLVIGQIETTSWNIHLANAFIGAGIGFFIGGALGTVDGLLVKRSLGRTLVGVFGGVLAGFFSGLVGLLLGGLVFVIIEGGLIARVLGWMALGLFLGLGQGLVSFQFRRAIYGLLGGALAWLVGGALYELFTQVFLQQSETVQMFLSAVGLVLMGASLGIIIPLSISVIGGLMAERGLVVYLNGPRVGTEIELIGSADLGSSDACQVYVPDASIEKKQALIDKVSKAGKLASGKREFFEIRNIGSQQTFWVNSGENSRQMPVPPGQAVPLQHGAQIVMGNIQLRFQLFLLFLLVVTGLPFISAAAQGDVPDDLVITIGQFDAENYPEITLYVNVTDKDGKNVGGLQQTDFQVTEDGATVEVVDFAGIGEARPVEIVYVFDTTGSMSEEIDGVIRTSIAFADELESKGRDYRLGLVTFGDVVLSVYRSDDTLTDSAEQFKDWVSVLSANGGEGDPENTYGALKRALQMQFRSEAQKIFILITDAPAHVYGDAPDGGGSFDDPDLVLGRIGDLLNEKSISVYAITPSFPDFTSLAEITGGRFYDLDNNPDFTGIIEEIGETIASQYRITYRSPRPTYDGTRRNVQIKIGQSDVSTEYHEQHLLTVQSNILVGVVCLLPLLAALILPLAVQYFLRSRGSHAAGSGAAAHATGTATAGTASFVEQSNVKPVVRTITAEAPPAVSPPPVCPSCGRPVRAGAKFCNSCGYRIISQ